jgi:hypothetical protein
VPERLRPKWVEHEENCSIFNVRFRGIHIQDFGWGDGPAKPQGIVPGNFAKRLVNFDADDFANWKSHKVTKSTPLTAAQHKNYVLGRWLRQLDGLYNRQVGNGIKAVCISMQTTGGIKIK